MKLSFYSDPGHGWLAVPLELLDRLQLLDRVSHYSYLRGRLAHLEEDCDASLFLAAARSAGIAVTYREINCANRYSRIRNYDPYSAERAKRNLANIRGAVL
jgi:hypothetical protein